MNEGQILDALAGLTLFSDLERPQLEAVAHTMSEESFPAGQRILRQGFSGGGFFVILDGEVTVRVDGVDITKLAKGDFFGEISLLLGEPPIADVVTLSPVRALQLAGPDLRAFLLAYPPVMYRMLQSVGRRLERANRRG
ncbi:MAG TPA: cyclic nucleotide-binding domain-containing protein [Candidatus Limnocylindrales bacterium]|nr:cyclic nucleotide-binding domain-containing protein [Candidatus Limnocylindrales bacterium]